MRSLSACLLSACILVSEAVAAPPGALLNQKVVVPATMRTGVFATDRSLTVPPGFQISVWARLTDARFIALAPNGDVFVSQPDLGSISILRPDPNGGDPARFTWASGLNSPQGLAFDIVDGQTWLYVGESDQIDRYIYKTGDTAAPASRQVLVSNLTDHDAHPYKDIAIGPDHTVYFGFGSSANVSVTDTEVHPPLAAIYRMNPDGINLYTFASGLRNPEGLAFAPGTNTLWATVNNRDDIPYPYHDATGNYGKIVPSYVDDHPPDFLTSVRGGGNYGWPFCNSTEDSPNGYNLPPFDPDLDTNSDGHVDCSTMDRVTKGVQAHSAPLGLMFLQGTGFAAPYRNGAVIGFHGSWNRTVPTGYKVAYFPWNPASQAPGDQIDLVTGFIGFARPVAAAVDPNGALLITDDSSGTLYKLAWAPSAVSAASGYALVAPASYAAAYGSGLASQTASAPAPYPASLGGISLTLTDAAGHSFTAPLVYVSPAQINFIVPDGVAAGTARLTLNAGSNSRDLGSPEIRATSPGLFSLSGDGSGIAAATAVDSQGKPVTVFSCTTSSCSGTGISVTGSPVYLSLYGTGIRGAASSSLHVTGNGVSLPVTYSGAQGTYPGLDQINVTLPASLAGAGDLQLQIEIAGTTSNPVTIRVN